MPEDSVGVGASVVKLQTPRPSNSAKSRRTLHRRELQLHGSRLVQNGMVERFAVGESFAIFLSHDKPCFRPSNQQ